nr:hypothetical protein Iba_chr02bCG20910 [Ipomoea batatas]
MRELKVVVAFLFGLPLSIGTSSLKTRLEETRNGGAADLDSPRHDRKNSPGKKYKTIQEEDGKQSANWKTPRRQRMQGTGSTGRRHHGRYYIADLKPSDKIIRISQTYLRSPDDSLTTMCHLSKDMGRHNFDPENQLDRNSEFANQDNYTTSLVSKGNRVECAYSVDINKAPYYPRNGGWHISSSDLTVRQASCALLRVWLLDAGDAANQNQNNGRGNWRGRGASRRARQHAQPGTTRLLAWAEGQRSQSRVRSVDGPRCGIDGSESIKKPDHAASPEVCSKPICQLLSRADQKVFFNTKAGSRQVVSRRGMQPHSTLPAYYGRNSSHGNWIYTHPQFHFLAAVDDKATLLGLISGCMAESAINILQTQGYEGSCLCPWSKFRTPTWIISPRDYQLSVCEQRRMSNKHSFCSNQGWLLTIHHCGVIHYSASEFEHKQKEEIFIFNLGAQPHPSNYTMQRVAQHLYGTKGRRGLGVRLILERRKAYWKPIKALSKTADECIPLGDEQDSTG